MEKLEQWDIENKYHKDNIMSITNSSIRRIARRGGVKRINRYIYDQARVYLKDFLVQTIRDSIIYMDHAKRSSLSAMDVIYALKRKNRTLYGFDCDNSRSNY